MIPEELEQPAVLAEAERYAAAFKAMPGFVEAVRDPAAHAEALPAIPARPPARGAKAEAQSRLVERAAADGPQALKAADQLRLLADAQALQALHHRVQAGNAHADWSTRAAASPAPMAHEPEAPPVQSIASAH